MEKTIVSLMLMFACVVSVTAQHPEIQVIYFQPTDVPVPDKDDFEKITETLTEVQSFYRAEMIGCLYWSVITTENPNVVAIVLAHELGHSFGLDHRAGVNLLMNPKVHDDGFPKTLKRYRIAAAAAKTLSQHPFFHEIPVVDIPIEEPVKNPDLQLPVSPGDLKIRLWGELKRVW